MNPEKKLVWKPRYETKVGNHGTKLGIKTETRFGFRLPSKTKLISCMFEGTPQQQNSQYNIIEGPFVCISNKAKHRIFTTLKDNGHSGTICLEIWKLCGWKRFRIRTPSSWNMSIIHKSDGWHVKAWIISQKTEIFWLYEDRTSYGWTYSRPTNPLAVAHCDGFGELR